MRQLNLDLISAPDPLAFAWGKKSFRGTAFLMAFLCALAALIFSWSVGISDVGDILALFLFFASIGAVATTLVLSVYKAIHREAAIASMILLGAYAELYHYFGMTEAADYEEAFLTCLKALESGRGRPWTDG